MKDKILAMAGLARRAGKAVSGEFAVEKSVKTGKAMLVLLAEDASANTKKKFRNMCAWYNVPIYEHSDKEALGKSQGHEIRSGMAVEDAGMAASIIRLLEAEKEPDQNMKSAPETDREQNKSVMN